MRTWRLGASSRALGDRVARTLAVLLAVGALLGPAAAVAGGRGLQVGVVAGLNRSILTAPEDPEPLPTFMSGTAFNGFSGAGGVTARLPLTPFLSLHVDLLVSHDRATGFEEVGTRRRELSMSSVRLRVPLTLQAGYVTDAFRVEGGLGPELAVPLTAKGEMEETGIPEEESFLLRVDAVSALGMALALGGAVHVDGDLWIPTELRLTWFPGVATESQERFDGFQSLTDPGTFVVAYDWTFLWTAGVAFDVL